MDIEDAFWSGLLVTAAVVSVVVTVGFAETEPKSAGYDIYVSTGRWIDSEVKSSGCDVQHTSIKCPVGHDPVAGVSYFAEEDKSLGGSKFRCNENEDFSDCSKRAFALEDEWEEIAKNPKLIRGLNI